AQRSWQDLSGGKPVVVVFVKNGCPCSAEFEPYFHRVAAAYPDSVRFAAVIDGDVPAARRFAGDNHVPFPVIADESKAIIERFRAEHGATVVLLSPSGKRAARWPGCSQEMMRDLGALVARLGDVPEQPIKVVGLPGALTAGCAYTQ
ncbi:MAG: peroxiredoxin family protein, partial [Planctomycetia bacterium]